MAAAGAMMAGASAQAASCRIDGDVATPDGGMVVIGERTQQGGFELRKAIWRRERKDGASTRVYADFLPVNGKIGPATELSLDEWGQFLAAGAFALPRLTVTTGSARPWEPPVGGVIVNGAPGGYFTLATAHPDKGPPLRPDLLQAFNTGAMVNITMRTDDGEVLFHHSWAPPSRAELQDLMGQAVADARARASAGQCEGAIPPPVQVPGVVSLPRNFIELDSTRDLQIFVVPDTHWNAGRYVEANVLIISRQSGTPPRLANISFDCRAARAKLWSAQSLSVTGAVVGYQRETPPEPIGHGSAAEAVAAKLCAKPGGPPVGRQVRLLEALASARAN